MTVGELWAIAGLLLCGAELLAPGVFLLWIGFAAIGTGALATFVAMSWAMQIATFIALALVLIAGAWRRVRRRRPDLVNAPSAGLVGTICTAIDFHAGVGRVAMRDGTWQARLPNQGAPAPGTLLRVVGLEGTTLLVEPVTR